MELFLKGADAKLFEEITILKSDPSNHYGLHFTFSKLQEHYRSEYQIRIALNILGDIFKESEGKIFLCKDSDIFIIYKGTDKILLEKAIFQLRYLFVDDVLAYTPDGDENPEFCSVYDLSFQWRQFYQICKERAGIKVTKGDARIDSHQKPRGDKLGSTVVEIKSASDNDNSLEAIADTTMTPGRLAAITRELVNADLQQALRRQPICAATKGIEFRPVYDEIYINIQNLRRLIGTKVNLTSDKWLFKYLTNILDGFVLDTLAKNSFAYLNSPVSINLNITTLLSDKFLKFNAKVRPDMRRSVILEINIADVFNDMDAFKTAQDLASQLGYRICLDGLSSHSFVQINRESLGFNLAKLQWNADMRSDLDTYENARLKEAIIKCGSNRMILCRCDTKNAIDYGHGLGISLFQGRYPDSVLNPDAEVIN